MGDTYYFNEVKMIGKALNLKLFDQILYLMSRNICFFKYFQSVDGLIFLASKNKVELYCARYIL